MMQAGMLVSDEMVNRLVEERIDARMRATDSSWMDIRELCSRRRRWPSC